MQIVLYDFNYFMLQDCRVIIWRKNEKEGGSWTHQVLHKFNEAIWHVSWSLAGNILAVSGAENKVFVIPF